ncbi:MAG: SH3 domain-containing protein [Deferribacteraceae bacterium]|nr:SH3 domain-containing protein [Deferribacteraceae bacterium]
MINRFCVCLGVIFVSTFFFIHTSVAEFDCGSVNIETGKLMVRKCAGTECAVIGKLDNGTPVCPTQIKGDWVEFQYNKSKGYVSTSFLKACPNKKIGSPQTVEATFLELHEGNFYNATFRLAGGTEITVIHEDIIEVLKEVKKGDKVSIKYQVEQYFFNRSECRSDNILQSVKILPGK